MSRTSVIEQIREFDPSYDPLTAALSEAGVSRERFDAAYDRVVIDGNFGPINPADWREQDGREPATVSEALEVLSAVSDAIDDYRETDVTDGGEIAFVDADQIRRDLFRSVIDIYGHLPF